MATNTSDSRYNLLSEPEDDLICLICLEVYLRSHGNMESVEDCSVRSVWMNWERINLARTVGRQNRSTSKIAEVSHSFAVAKAES